MDNSDLEFEYRTKSKLKISKKNGESELLTFSLPFFGFLEICCIVTIPSQEETSAPVYVKVRRSRKPNLKQISNGKDSFAV